MNYTNLTSTAKLAATPSAPEATLPISELPTVSLPRLALVGTLFSLVWSSAFRQDRHDVHRALDPAEPALPAGGRVAGAARALARRERPSAPSDRSILLIALAAGLLTNAVYLGLAYSGMRTAPAGLTAILASTSPLLTALLAALWLREPFGWHGALGQLAGFAGVVWIMGGRTSSMPADTTGVLLILAGTMALAASTLLNRRPGPLVQLPASGLALLPLAWWREGLAIRLDAAFFGSLIYQAAVVSIGTTLMLLWLVRHGGAARAGSFHLLNPAFGTLLAVGLLQEAVPASDLVGVLPIVAGLALFLRPGR
ncbi:MAG: DMT family transporter [Thiobacillus sp.]